jgi:hypothetical protein
MVLCTLAALYLTVQYNCTAYTAPLYISRTVTAVYKITELTILALCAAAAQVLHLTIFMYCLYCPTVHQPHRYCTLQYYYTVYTAPLYISRTSTVPYNFTKLPILPLCTSAEEVQHLTILLYCLYWLSVHQPHRYCTLQYYCTAYTARLYISSAGTVPFNIIVLPILPLCTSAQQALHLRILKNILPICTSAAQVPVPVRTNSKQRYVIVNYSTVCVIGVLYSKLYTAFIFIYSRTPILHYQITNQNQRTYT